MLLTATYCWASIYAYICILHLGRYVYRHDTRDLIFAGYSAGQTIYTLGQAGVISAALTEQAVAAMTPVAVGTALGTFSFTVFCERERSGWSWLCTVSLALTAAGLLLSSLSLITASPVELIQNQWGFSGYDFIKPRLSLAATIYVSLHFGVAALSWFRLKFAGKRDRASQVLMLAMGVNLIAGVWDLIVRNSGFEAPYLLEHLTVLSIIAMSHVLTEEALETTEQLDIKKRDLMTTAASLAQARELRLNKGYLVTVGRMAASIAHEVRNPLTAIKNAQAGIKDGRRTSDEWSVLLAIIESQAKRLNSLLQDLRTFAEDHPLALDRITPRDLIDSSLRQLDPTKAAGISVHVPDTLPSIDADQTLLSRALSKVLANATAAISAGGEVQIRATLEMDWVVFECKDNGEGMGYDVLQQATDPFFSGRAQGVGLGLALARRAISRHGGTLSLESEESVGTTVRFKLPIWRRSALR